MKRSILYNIFAALAMFGVTAMQDGASGPGAPTGSPLKRINSQTQLLLQAEGDELKSSSGVTFSKKQYIEANKEMMDRMCNGLRHCCSRLGVKKMTIYDKSGEKSTTVGALDISWGSIRSYAHKVLDEDKICLELKERLGDYLSILDNVTERTRANKEWNSTAFEGDELERLCAMCFHEGKDSLFECGINSDRYDPNIFKEKFLVPTLCNFTGFQTIASLMVISILNQDSNVGFNRISRIVVSDDKKYSLIPFHPSLLHDVKADRFDPFHPSLLHDVKADRFDPFHPSGLGGVRPDISDPFHPSRLRDVKADRSDLLLLLSVNPADISDPHIKFTHECLHAVIEMLGIASASDSNIWDDIVKHSVLGTPQLDYFGLFAPIMKCKDLHERLVSCLFDTITNGGQCEAKTVNQTVNQKALQEDLNFLAMHGVGYECNNCFNGNLAQHFNSAKRKNAKRKNAKQKNDMEELKLKMAIKTACLSGLLYATSCPATDKLVMYGILPLQYRRKPFVICSNQNEYIMTKREILAKDVDRIHDSEQDWGIYRYHAVLSADGNTLSMPEFVNRAIECIARRLSNIGLGEYEDLKEIVRDYFSKEDTSSLLASFYPSSLLHRMATEKGSVSISEEANTDIGTLFQDYSKLL